MCMPPLPWWVFSREWRVMAVPAYIHGHTWAAQQGPRVTQSCSHVSFCSVRQCESQLKWFLKVMSACCIHPCLAAVLEMSITLHLNTLQVKSKDASRTNAIYNQIWLYKVIARFWLNDRFYSVHQVTRALAAEKFQESNAAVRIYSGLKRWNGWSCDTEGLETPVLWICSGAWTRHSSTFSWQNWKMIGRPLMPLDWGKRKVIRMLEK